MLVSALFAVLLLVGVPVGATQLNTSTTAATAIAAVVRVLVQVRKKSLTTNYLLAVEEKLQMLQLQPRWVVIYFPPESF